MSCEQVCPADAKMQAGRLVCSAFVKAQNQDHQDRGLTRTHVNRPSAAMAFNQLPNGTPQVSVNICSQVL